MTNILHKAKEALMKALSPHGDIPDILKRDITGECVGECRDRVKEGEIQRQREINLSSVEDIKSYPSRKPAFVRNEPPGLYGGHV
jgi:hypothetical protein